MATQTLTASELSNAQRVTLTRIYQSYQNKTDLLGWIDELPADKVNKKGLQVPFEVSPNPSLSIGTGEGDVFATAQASNYDNFVVTYTNLNAGVNETYAAMLNNNVETSEDVFRFQAESDAKQFSSFLNNYASRGNSTGALATVSANYSAATVAVCNGTTDSIGPSQLVVGGWYTIWDATGATQRTAGGATNPIQLTSKTTANAVFAAQQLPTDMVDTDIIVPQVTAADASTGIYGLPIIIDSAGTYYGKSRTTYGGLASFEKAAGGSLTAGMLSETYFSTVQRGGYFGSDQLIDQVSLICNTGNLNNYYNLTLSSGAIVGGPHVFRHDASSNPKMDLGMASMNFTWFGAPIKVANAVRGDEIYFFNRKHIRRAVLKPVGYIADGMPASDYLQQVNGSGDYLQARLRYMDWFGNIYSPQPYMLGKISGLTLVAPTQKATMVLTA